MSNAFKKTIVTDTMTGRDKMSLMISNYGCTNGDAIDHYSLIELERIHDALLHSGWDIYPDHWTLRQHKEALKGIAPDFRDDESTPDYSDPERRRFASALRAKPLVTCRKK